VAFAASRALNDEAAKRRAACARHIEYRRNGADTDGGSNDEHRTEVHAMKGFVAVTDNDWFDFLRSMSPPAEEVNFWRPSEDSTLRALEPGELLRVAPNAEEPP
jgi:hypothetical protein